MKKKPPLINFSGNKILFRQNCHALLQNTFTHIIRTNINHGIETAEDRKTLGKNEAGTISIKFSVVNDQLNIEVQDDGPGINMERLYQKGIESGRKLKTTPYDQLQLLEKLGELQKSGIITEKEFQEKKKKILSKI